ncbi:hypothetical protein FJZ31_23545 [Candidatus Poribacteria bacterium]|nr:hypothetical protein [Candidatus Poribacteria bacterium]
MLSGQAIVKPEDVRRFTSELKQFTNKLNNDSSRLQAQFKRLGETWRDQEHMRFAQEFEQATKVFKKFMEDSNQYIAYLIRKAEAAEAYLRQR